MLPILRYVQPCYSVSPHKSGDLALVAARTRLLDRSVVTYFLERRGASQTHQSNPAFQSHQKDSRWNMASRVRTRNAERPSYREDDSEDEELDEKLSEDSFEEDESDHAAPSRKRQKTNSQASSARGRSLPSRPAVRTRRQPQMSYAEDLSADESGDDNFDDDLMEVEEVDGPFSSPKAKKFSVVKRETKKKVVRSPRKAPSRRERRRDRSSSLPAPLPARTRRAFRQKIQIHIVHRCLL